MKVRDCFALNPTGNTNKYSDFINYIDTSSVNAGRLSNVTYLEEDFPSRAQRLVNKGDILYSSVRPNLRHYYFYYDNLAHAVASTGFVLLRNKSKYDTKFAYYFLTTNEIVKHLSNIAELSQSTFPSFSTKDIGKIDLPQLDEDRQKKIASILSEYDDLIEVNIRRIKVLEQMAENLYKEWFVRFRFPGHETAELIDSKLGKLPSSFSIAKMDDVFDYYIGGGWGNDEEDKDFPVEAYVIRGTDFPKVAKGDISTCPLRYHKKSNYESRELQANDIILEVSGGTAEQPVGRTLLVTEDTIERLGGKVICASFCKQIRVNAKTISPMYFYYWMQFLYDTRIIDRFQLQSTGIINFQFEYFLKKGEVMLPSKEIMEQFDNMIRPIHKEIAAIAKQNDNLIKQKELLLPRLMSGKLEV